jgi:LPXTG-motif cell wall-anchored protein
MVPGSGNSLSGVPAPNMNTIANMNASGALNAAPALPATGTQETLLLVIAAIVSFALVLFVRSRRA